MKTIGDGMDSASCRVIVGDLGHVTVFPASLCCKTRFGDRVIWVT
jgi:hypothetical protein